MVTIIGVCGGPNVILKVDWRTMKTTVIMKPADLDLSKVTSLFDISEKGVDKDDIIVA